MSLKSNEKIILSIEGFLLSALVVFAAFFGSRNGTFKNYYLVCILAIAVAVGCFLLGFRRNRNYLRANALRVVIISMLFFGIVVYSAGVLLGFRRGFFRFEPRYLLAILLPTILIHVLTEVLRYVVFSGRVRRRYFYFIFSGIIIFLNLLLSFDVIYFSSIEHFFLYTCEILIPTVAFELLAGYLCYRFGLLPTLVFKLPLYTYSLILPIIPELGHYLHSLALVTMTFFIYTFCNKLIRNTENDAPRIRRFRFNLLMPPLLVVTAGLIALVSGVFGYQIIAISSNSMEPVFSRGDALVFQKVAPEEIRKGDILVFNNGSRIVTHRVMQIFPTPTGPNFITQGDANTAPDVTPIPSEQVMGRACFTTKYIGFPTVWFNDLLKGDRK